MGIGVWPLTSTSIRIIMGALSAVNEQLRVEELRRYAVMDSDSEPAYDEIVRLAAFICETPIALISLVDDTRQWFKARHGLEAEYTSRDIAFCSHALDNPDRFLIVPDTLEDERFSSSILVVSHPYIRFYAGAPLV